MRRDNQKKPDQQRKGDLWDQTKLTLAQHKAGDVSHLTGISIPEIHATVYPRILIKGKPVKKKFDKEKIVEKYLRGAKI